MYYEPNDAFLMHYGVKGMKWGHRKAYRQTVGNARQQRKASINKAFSRYEKDIHNIEKGYKRGQNLSKKDQAREHRAEDNYNNAVKKANSTYKATKKQAKADYKQNVKESIVKRAKAHDKQVKKDTDRYGVIGVGLRGAVANNGKRFRRKIATHLINETANNFIAKADASYATKRGVDFIRKSAIAGLSVSQNIDDLKVKADVARAILYKGEKTVKKFKKKK